MEGTGASGAPRKGDSVEVPGRYNGGQLVGDQGQRDRTDAAHPLTSPSPAAEIGVLHATAQVHQLVAVADLSALSSPSSTAGLFGRPGTALLLSWGTRE